MRAAVIGLLLLGCAALVHADNIALRNADQCKGVCQDVSKKGCDGGNYVRRLCPGNKDIQCCVPTPTPGASPSSDGVGAACAGGVGVCQLKSHACAGEFVAGQCPGNTLVQCCRPKQTPPSSPVAPASFEKFPAFSKLWQYYPHGEAADVKRRIGGNINADYLTNTCTIRVTRAMAMSGYDMDPTFKLANGKNIMLVKGGDGKLLAIRVAEFKQYVLKKFGPPTIKHVNPGDGSSSIPSEFNGKTGVIMYDVRVWSDATGHFDFWNGSKCAHECYFDKAREVWLWVVA